MKKTLIVALAACASLMADSVGAATFTFSTPSGATENGGNPVDATAAFTPGANTLNIQLTDLLANPTTVAQLLSDLSFGVAGASGASLTSGSGVELTVHSDGSFTPGGAAPAGWVLSNPSSGTLLLDVLAGPGHAGPAHTIIGPPGAGGTYSAAVGSIAGNGPHNPFLFGTVSFTINAPGLTVNSAINDVVFSFGTTAGDNVPGVLQVPEGGTTVILLGATLTGLGLIRRKLS
jgi:hypothetical protein